jgi:hypothetical protein
VDWVRWMRKILNVEVVLVGRIEEIGEISMWFLFFSFLLDVDDLFRSYSFLAIWVYIRILGFMTTRHDIFMTDRFLFYFCFYGFLYTFNSHLGAF